MDSSQEIVNSRVGVKVEKSIKERYPESSIIGFLEKVAEDVPSAVESWPVMAVVMEELAQLAYANGESFSGYQAFDVNAEGSVSISGSATLEDFYQVYEDEIFTGLSVLGVGGPEAQIFSQMGAEVVVVDPRFTSNYDGEVVVVGLALNEQIKAFIAGRYGQFDVAMSCMVFHPGNGVYVPDVGIEYGEEERHGVRLAELVDELVKPGGVSVHNGSMAGGILAQASVDGEIVVDPRGKEGQGHQSVWVVRK